MALSTVRRLSVVAIFVVAGVVTGGMPGRAAAAASGAPSLERAAVCFQTRGFVVVMQPMLAGSFGTNSVFGAWKGVSTVFVAVLPTVAEAQKVQQRERAYLKSLGIPNLTEGAVDAAVLRAGTVVYAWSGAVRGHVADVERCIGLRGELANGEEPLGGRFAIEAYAVAFQQANYQTARDGDLMTLASKCLSLGAPAARRRDSTGSTDRGYLAHPCAGYGQLVSSEYQGLSWWLGKLPAGESPCLTAARAVGPVEKRLADGWLDLRDEMTAPDLARRVAAVRPLVAAAKRARAAFFDACG